MFGSAGRIGNPARPDEMTGCESGCGTNDKRLPAAGGGGAGAGALIWIRPLDATRTATPTSLAPDHFMFGPSPRRPASAPDCPGTIGLSPEILLRSYTVAPSQ